MGRRDTVETAHMALGLVPEVLDAVDVVFLVGEQLGVVDAAVLEAGDVEHVVGAQRVGVDDRIGHHLGVDDGLQRSSPDVGDDLGIDLATAFEQAKHRNLARCTASALALAMAAEVALVDLDLAEQRCCVFTLLGDDLAQPVEVQRRRALVDTDQRGCCAGSGAGHEMLYQASLHCPLQSTLPHLQSILNFYLAKIVI